MLPSLTSGPRRLLVTTDAVGGVWRYALDLCAGMAEHGIEPVLAVMGPAASAAQNAEADAVGAYLVETGLPLDWTANDAGAVAAAQRALEELAGPHRCDGAPLHPPALAAARWNLPCVAVAHSCVATWWHANRAGGLPEDFRWRTGLVGAGLAHAHAVIVPTAAHGKAVEAAYGPQQLAVVYNGRRPQHRAVPAARRLHSLLAAGRLWDEAKGAAQLDRFAAQSGIPALAAGPLCGPNGGAVEFRALRALGNLDDRALAREYAACGAFVSLARYEPFGLAVLEAAQAGAPLILSDIASFRELWGGAAQFVPLGDDQALGDAVEAAFRYGAYWGRKAQDRAARFPPGAMVDGTLAVHARVATSDRPLGIPA